MYTKTFVKLNRQVGITNQRHNDPTKWQLLVPIKILVDTFNPPKEALNIKTFPFFKDLLKEGKTVLVNSVGGYNFLLPNDNIIEMWQEVFQ